MKPCPFCGAADRYSLSAYEKQSEWGPAWVIRCSSCRSYGPEGSNKYDAEFRWDERADGNEENGA